MDKTAEEIYELYKSAHMFVEAFPQDLREYCTKNAGIQSANDV